MRNIEKWPAIAAALVLFGGCATTAGSSGSTLSGLRSNFQSTESTFDGTFLATLDMNTVAAGHYEFADEDLQKLALTGDPTTARGFVGVAHSEIYATTGFRRNLVVTPEIIQPLNEIKERLLDAWDGPAPDIAIFVSGEASYHGQAFPKNFIVLPIGAVLDVTDPRTEINGQPNSIGSEDELAAFMAHEMAHILLGHYKRAEGMTLRDRLNNSASGLALVGIVATGLEMQGSGDNAQLGLKDEQRSNDLVRQAALANAIFKEGNMLLSASASREQEDHADMLASDLLARAGYRPANVKSFLERSEQGERRIAASLEELNSQQSVIATALVGQLGGGQGNLVNDLLSRGAVSIYQNFSNRASATHRSTAKRVENVFAYETRLQEAVYAEGVDPAQLDQTTQAYLAVFNGEKEAPSGAIAKMRTGRAAEILNAYRAAFEAQKLMLTTQEGAPERAWELLQSAVAAAPDEAEILLIEADYHTKTNNHGESVRVLERTIGLPGSGPLNYGTLAEAYISNRQYPKALEAIEKGEEATGTKLPFLPIRIAYHARIEEWGEAVSTNKICQESESETLRAKCTEMMAPVNTYLESQREKQQFENPFKGLLGGT